MAETLLYTLDIVKDVGTFNIGDEIELFYDDVTEDITVKQNTVEIFSGPVINPGDFYSQNYNYQFCDSTTLVSFGLLANYGIPFPYAGKLETENSPSCTAVVCDLTINNAKATDDGGTGTGTITVSATSSGGTIRYGLNNFRYGDGQTSNQFTGLLSGNYTVYAKDASGCSATKSVTVVFTPPYNTRYRLEFDNIKNETQVLIQQRQYAGGVTDVCLSGEFMIDYPSKSYDSFYSYVVWPSRFEVSLLNEVDQQFSTLYSEQHRRFRAIVSRGGSEVWRGFLQPNTFSEPNIPPPYPTRFTFIDGLVILQSIQISELNFDGTSSLFDYIYVILSEVGLELPIHVAVNVYSAGMNSSLSMLPQTYLKAVQFDREDLSCYDALEWMLLPFGCTLMQQNGAWWIVRHDQRGNTFTYHIFDTDGSYTGTSTYNGVLNMACPTVSGRIVNQGGDAIKDRMPSFGEIVLTDNFDLKESLIYNYDFEKLSELSTSGFDGWTFVLNGATDVSCVAEKTTLGTSLTMISSVRDDTGQLDSYVQSVSQNVRYKSGDRFRFKIKFAFSNYPSTVPFAIIRVALKFGTEYLQNDLTSWDTGFSTFRIYPDYDGDFYESSFEFRGPSGSGVTSTDLQLFVFNSNVYVPEYELTDNVNAITTTDLPVGYKINKMNASYPVSWPVNVGTPYAYRIQYYELIVGNDGDITPLDYDATTNNKSWRLIDEASILGRPQPGEVSKFYIDEAEIDYLPEGQEPVEDQETVFVLNEENPEILEPELNVGGLPFNYDLETELTVNDINNYNSQFTSVVGQFYNQWGRSGLNEAVRLQRLFISTLTEQHKDATQRITGSFTNQELGFASSPGTPVDVAPLSTVYDTYDGKYYIVVGYTSYDANRFYRLELVELKAGDAQTEFGAFSDGFSDGFS